MNKIKTYQVLGIFVAIASLLLSLSLLRTTYAYTGTSTVKKEIYDVQVKDISDIYKDNNNIEIIKNPLVADNIITYGVELKNLNEFVKFQFNIENKGNIDGIVRKIEILGNEEYQNYVNIEVKGLKVGDKIEANKEAKVDVITTYNNGLLNEEGMLEPIRLDEIKIKIIIDKE